MSNLLPLTAKPKNHLTTMPGPKTERRDTTVLQALTDINNKLAKQGEDLAVNTTETRNIRDRLDKLNGSVSNHDSRLNGIERNQDLLTQAVSNIGKREDGQSDTFRRWTDRLLWGLFVLFLLFVFAIAVKSGVVTDFLHPTAQQTIIK